MSPRRATPRGGSHNSQHEPPAGGNVAAAVEAALADVPRVDPETGKLPVGVVPMAQETVDALATKAPLASPTFTGALTLAISEGALPAGAPGVLTLYGRDVGTGIPGMDVVDPDGFRWRFGRDLFLIVLNQGSVEIPRGALLAVIGEAIVQPLGARFPVAGLAGGPAGSLAVGWAAQAIPAGGAGRMMTAGRLGQLSTEGLPLQGTLYLSDTTPGAYTVTPPAANAQAVGTVLSIGPAAVSEGTTWTGAIFVALHGPHAASESAGPPVQVTRATADATPTGTAYVDVPGLAVTFGAGERWLLELDAQLAGGSASVGVNLQVAPASPAVIASAWTSGVGFVTNTTVSLAAQSAMLAGGFNKTTSRGALRAVWVVTMGTTGGRVAVQAASSGAGTSRVYAGAVLRGTRLP